MNQEPFEHQNRFIRYSLFVTGWVSFILGMIGLLLPVVPTSPFLILSTACFLRSSPKFYYWLINHRWFGRYLHYYLSGEGIPRRVKVMVLSLLWVMILSSALLIVQVVWVSAIMLLVACAVTIYIIRQPEPTQNSDHAP